MSTEAQIQANQSNAQKSSGPKTDEGKAIVSSNAQKHGARSQRMINATEASAYQDTIDALTQQFSSENPLIKLQIERVSKIKIHLERVQALIDHAFEQANLETSINEYLISLLDLDEAQRAKIEVPEDTLEPDGIDIKRLEVAQALLKSDALISKTSEELLNACPEFSEYLISKTKELNVNLGTYVSHINSEPSSTSGLDSKLSLMLQKIVPKENRIINSDSILDIPYQDLLSAATKLATYINHIKELDIKVATFRLLQKSNQFSAQPNFEILNNLYRYQTTLQKQLSTTLGELLALDARQPK